MELKPDFAEAHNNLGVALKDQGKLNEAIACCRRALELKPDFAEAHNNLGNAFERTGKLDERRLLPPGGGTEPDSAKAHGNLGALWRRLGDLQGEKILSATALRHDYRFAFAHYKLAKLLGGKLPE